MRQNLKPATNAVRDIKRGETSLTFSAIQGFMKKKHIGKNFDDFLEADGILKEATVIAVKRITAWQTANQANMPTLSGIKRKLDGRSSFWELPFGG